MSGKAEWEQKTCNKMSLELWMLRIIGLNLLFFGSSDLIAVFSNIR